MVGLPKGEKKSEDRPWFVNNEKKRILNYSQYTGKIVVAGHNSFCQLKILLVNKIFIKFV